MLSVLAVFCISHVDVHLATELASWIKELGGVKNYPCLLVWDQELTNEQRAPIIADCQEAFAKVNQLEPRLEAEDRGWPAGPGKAFQTTAAYVSRFTNGGPWYFIEGDVVPVRSTWLDELTAEYQRCGKPCLGVLQQSWLEPLPGYKIPAGFHLVGTAIYPSDLPQYCNINRSFAHVAFDVALQDELVGSTNKHAAHTNLIAHRWLTENYRREGAMIVCDPREGALPGQKGYSLAIPVDDAACVVHGCKDLSLLNLLRAERRANQSNLETPTPRNPVQRRRIRPVIAQ